MVEKKLIDENWRKQVETVENILEQWRTQMNNEDEQKSEEHKWIMKMNERLKTYDLYFGKKRRRRMKSFVR